MELNSQDRMGKRKQCEADAGFNVEKNKKKKRKDEEETASLALESNVCAEDGKTTKKLKKKMNEMVNETRHVCEEVTEVKIKKKSKKHLEQENTKSKVEKKRKKIHKTEVRTYDMFLRLTLLKGGTKRDGHRCSDGVDVDQVFVL
ncbi:hypothetical protein AGIG_G17436 [Arapaima gigas]